MHEYDHKVVRELTVKKTYFSRRKLFHISSNKLVYVIWGTKGQARKRSKSIIFTMLSLQKMSLKIIKKIAMGEKTFE